MRKLTNIEKSYEESQGALQAIELKLVGVKSEILEIQLVLDKAFGREGREEYLRKEMGIKKKCLNLWEDKVYNEKTSEHRENS